jgi:hypothetical protein
MAKHGQDAVGAVAVSWSRTYSFSMVTAMRRTVRVGGSSWDIISHDTAIPPDSTPSSPKAILLAKSQRATLLAHLSSAVRAA